MAKSPILLNRFLSLIFALVILISLFPAVPAFAAEASSSDGELSSVGAVPSSGDAAAVASYTVSGVWVIKSSISFDYTLDESLSFSSNGVSYSKFRFVFVPTVPVARRIFYVTSNESTTVVYDNSWKNSSYRTVDFGSSPQTVSSQFYTWLTSNATKQVKYTYTLKLDGSSVLTYTSSSATVKLNFEIFNDSAYFYFGSDYGNGYDKGYSNDDNQRFAGISKYSNRTQLEYAPGADGPTYTIDVPSTSPTLNLYSVYEYPLYIDPNGGSWNGSTATSVFWDLPTMDTDEIYNPVRPGYVFSGWSFSGGGEFNDAGDPPYNYEHGTSPGYLTANWVAEEVPTYTHTISIDGSSYTFTADNAAPPVQIQVLPSGISMTYGNSTKSWTYSGSDTFVGIKDSSGNTYDVGASFSLLGSSGSNKTSILTVEVAAPDPDPSETYTHTIIIDGSSYVFVGETGAPPVTFDVRDDYVILSFGDQEKYWYYQGSGTFQGIRNTATGDLHGPAAWFSLLGSTGSNKTSTFTVEVSDSGNDFVIPAGQYEAKKAIMTGEYVALPSWPADLDSVPFAFKSSGLNYQSMSLGMYLPTSQAQLQYGSTAAYRYAGIDQSAGFTQGAFALVYLASDQAVPEAFYNWFTSAFTRISDGLVSPTYSVTINIWNAAGTSVLRTVTYSGTLCPVATLQVTENGCIISCPGQDSIEWSTSGEFYGFRLYKVSTNAIYTPGNSYSLPGGAASDVVVDLFYADTASESQVQELFSGVSSFLVQPIMVFFNIEFIPGLSFSRIAMFAFVLGLVWWFLKVSK